MSTFAPESLQLSSQEVPPVPLAPVRQQDEAEVWIEGVTREIVVTSGSSTTTSSNESSSPQTARSISEAGSTNVSPSQTPSSRPTIMLSSLGPVPEEKRDADQESDDDEPL